MGGFILFFAVAAAFLLINLSRIYLIGKFIKGPKKFINDVAQGEESKTVKTSVFGSRNVYDDTGAVQSGSR
ncbi:hypothetical protein [Ruminococcus albus]|uniref:hypothetical protein n=1 Tax=Ruminococcus albus TaxID=1264 RepID=UPI00046564F1|nr:hypothetical protein [Ruminococcus albus]